MTYGSGTVGGEVATSSHHSHTNGSKSDHEKETFSTTPDIEDLGQGNVDSGSHAVGYNANDGNERVQLEAADNVRGQAPGDVRLEGVDEVEREHAALSAERPEQYVRSEEASKSQAHCGDSAT